MSEDNAEGQPGSAAEVDLADCVTVGLVVGSGVGVRIDCVHRRFLVARPGGHMLVLLLIIILLLALGGGIFISKLLFLILLLVLVLFLVRERF